jgi:tetratricopeptide (TPR) repeat protein
MRSRFAISSLAAASLFLGAFAADAQPKEAPKAAAPPAKDAGKAAAPPAPGTKGPDGIRRDPDGVRGISPYMEAVKKGEDAYVARDFQGAVTAFQDAIKLDTQKMLAYYRIGEAQLALNNFAEAEAQWQNALTKTGTDEMKAKVLFVLADLRERQAMLEEAKTAWNAYATFCTEHPKALTYAATALERVKVIDKRIKDLKDYGEVKERTKKREDERIKEAAETAKKAAKNK